MNNKQESTTGRDDVDAKRRIENGAKPTGLTGFACDKERKQGEDNTKTYASRINCQPVFLPEHGAHSEELINQRSIFHCCCCSSLTAPHEGGTRDSNNKKKFAFL